jgi:hypothetical protein
MSKRNRRNTMIRAGAESGSVIKLAGSMRCEVIAAAGGEGAKSRPTIRMTAYTGGPMEVGFGSPVVVDLAGLRFTAKGRPLLANHRSDQIVGHTTGISKDGGSLQIEGTLSGANAITEEIIASAANGFPWQASIGANIVRRELVNAGASAQANGRTFRGPVIIAREAILREISVVALGADDDTTTSIAARRQEADMDFEAWLKANGFDNQESLTEAQLKPLRAAFQADKGGKAPDPTRVNPGDLDKSLNDMRAAHAAELDRFAKLEQICEGHTAIQAQAVRENWSLDKAQLEVLRADRPTVNGITRGGRDEPARLTAEVVEAGLLASMGMPDAQRQAMFSEKILEAARPLETIGLKELAMLACEIDRKPVPPVFGDGERVIQAAFSTVSLPGILENVLNKQALATYKQGDIQALSLARLSNASDFKPGSRVRMLGTGKFSRVGAAGELESGKVSDQKFPIQADTFGQVVFIDRQTIINDDLQMLMDAGTEMGNAGREVINELLFTELLNAGSFFSTGASSNNNLISGASSALSSTSLNAAATAFRKQKAGPGTKTKDSRPINISPAILLVPPELEVTAQILVGSNDIRPGGSNTEDRSGTFNPWRGRFRVVSAPHLSDTSFVGASATAWYLLAEPNILPALELTFLRGRREPRVERVSPPANQLGVGYRGYLDVGAARMDPRGIVKSTGVA